MNEQGLSSLKGKKGLIVGIANQHSIAWGCAKVLHAAGADIAVTYLNQKAEPYVRPLAETIHAPIIAPLDMSDDSQLNDLFGVITQQWGTLDFVIHAIAFAPLADLHGRVTDSSRDGFLKAMDISCHSFIRVAHMAEPLMAKQGGSLLTLSYYGAEKVVEHYGIMGLCKAALESSVKYLAAELGDKKIRVNALSPGPIATRAASGIEAFEHLISHAIEKAPEHSAINIEQVGHFARFLVSDESQLVTGGTYFIDAGLNIMAA
ncbi:enoyl-ACP reductase FabI [Aliikangiella maris]|uniref:Enoyl-[acyl-carrier-protein] reductase [NADH] n=2 Tax=Aliikangiella maris TaxID=3162458 RepID=A0ABV3MS67_9GAMM